MSNINADDVRKVAKLARLDLPEDKIATYFYVQVAPKVHFADQSALGVYVNFFGIIPLYCSWNIVLVFDLVRVSFFFVPA